ncbi:hypothetical protein TVAG_084450 [Trichomonas vaginalis G3]|uniref:Uncharacterized protein n=1 Tax=Trichomonas vaginalis (strain ATCC PRA-98 / G3) TaxID=412133 RepID=A2G0U8_TRIV3|nr:hypothetical protein TVAGG3_0293860 [Trichomonas vaginalis G3]EAX89214.1 hypothetical protein TVAG_084450 [Trichomonas vaginalis G3]KAI5527470.1 hypothetical protein TVAGG3_0293860 [Trichomonas vaginalis G3]|eukprot:XP_001302144.1 hypothetical protein [Trichomonas vaginalis G3]
MTYLSEFGSDFPISNGIKSVFDKCRSLKTVTRFIRTLLSVCYAYEDNSLLIIPLKYLQTSKACREIIDYISNPQQKPFSGIIFTKFQCKITEISSLPSDTPKFIVVLESGEYITYLINNDAEPTIVSKRFSIAGLVDTCKVFFPYLACYVKENDKYNVYAASLIAPNFTLGKQCITNKIYPFYVTSPSVYIIKDDGLYGCSLDETGQRIFPRELSLVVEAKGLVHIRTNSGFYLYQPDTSEILRVEGRKITSTKLDEKAREASILFAIGPVLIGLCKKSIIEFDFINGNVKAEKETKETDSWILSLEESYGAVMLGSGAYSLSRTSVPPTINLFASPKEIKEQLKRAKEATGTVATSIILMANRSPYLAAVLMKDELKAEIATAPPPGSLQDFLRPTLIKINNLLQSKPE